jgi:hypothetical protein
MVQIMTIEAEHTYSMLLFQFSTMLSGSVVTMASRVLRLLMEEEQWGTADKRWSSRLGVGRGARNSSPYKNKFVT